MSTHLFACDSRIPQLDFVRVVLMMGVITIHVSSTYIFVESCLSIGNLNLAFYLNQAARFSVPGFVLLSGLSLRLGKSKEHWRKFYAGRVKKVLIPYLLWYAIYSLWYVLTNDSVCVGVWWFIKGLFTGATSPHLYFIIIVLQLYLLYPLLRKLKRTALLILTFFSAVIQIIIWLDCAHFSLLPSGNLLYLLGITWLCYFIPPMLLCKEQVLSLLDWFSKHLRSLLLLSLILSLACTVEGWALSTYEMSIRPILFVYTPVAVITMAALSFRLMKNTRLQFIISKLSIISMDIFFSHVLILDILRNFSIFSHGMIGMFMLFVVCFILSVVLSFLLRQLKVH